MISENETIMLRLLKQRLPLKQEKLKELELIRQHRSNFTKICGNIKKINDEIDSLIVQELKR